MALSDTTLDFDRVGAFAGQLMSQYVGTLTTYMLAVGWRSGALEALATGPATSEALADRAGLSERHVREWLGAMTAAGITTYDPASGEYALPVEHALCLTGDGPANTSPIAEGVAYLGRFVPAVTRTMEDGGGIPYREYWPEFDEIQDQMNRRVHDATLVEAFVPLVDGLTDRLHSGIDVADIGCGRGHVVNLLARAFPESRFVGFDLSTEAIEAARREAASFGLTNARFEQRDVTALPADAGFDVITAFDAIHDQVQPRKVLHEVRRSLRVGGAFLMVDMDASSNVEDNVGNPMATFFYSVSLLHCMQVSLAEGGEGLGTAWGRQRATELLAEAGFDDVRIIDTPPEDPVNVIYLARVDP